MGQGSDTRAQALRDLPAVHELAGELGGAHALAVQAARRAIDEHRSELLSGVAPAEPLSDRARRVLDELQSPSLRRVINATGVIVHTNLGRAPLAAAAREAVARAAEGYSNLELDLEGGERGSRQVHVEGLLCELTAAEAALVVNNGAGAVLLAAAALAGPGRGVVVSRGQLVEIGGGFRIPDVMRQSGVSLIEVGTTNRTYATDFAAAITERTALLLRVHASNFLQVGFVHQPSLAELVEVGARHNLPVVDDLGSGSLLDTARFGLATEPMVQASVAAGLALVAFSGDKLLGGPQAGIIVGHTAEIGVLRKHPLMRAIRPDKLTLAALGATLVHYLRGEAERDVPVWRMITASDADLQSRARALASQLGAGVVESRSAIGGGSLPGQTQPSWAVALDSPTPDRVAAALRHADPPVIARIDAGRVLLDLRAILPEQDEPLCQAVAGITAHESQPTTHDSPP